MYNDVKNLIPADGLGVRTVGVTPARRYAVAALPVALLRQRRALDAVHEQHSSSVLHRSRDCTVRTAVSDCVRQ